MDIIAPAASPAPATPAVGAEPSIESLASLIPDTALRADPSVDTSTAPAVAETPADASDAAKIASQPEGEQPAEPAKVEAPAPDAIDTEALDRAEQAAKRAREGSRRYREMFESQQRQQAEVQRAAREAEQFRQQVEEARRLREDLTKDPYAALKRLGMTDQDLAERALREGTPEAAIHALKETIEQERQARAALENRLQSERAAAARQQAEASFARVADNETAYPRLAQLGAQAQLAVAKAALQQILNNGYEVGGFTDDQVAEACEKFLAPKKAGKAAAKTAPAPAPAVTPKTTASKTLTNAVATERAVQARPWHELSEDEQIAQIAAALPDP